MKYSVIITLAALVLLMVNCESQRQLVPSRSRQLKPKEVTAYHMPVEMKVAWVPYKNLELKQTKANNWVIVENEDGKTGAIPVMLITYPATGDSVWVQMDTRNELLGQLIKHSLMTQKPISEPYDQYLADAACSSCHPKDVKVDFDK